MTLSRRSLRNVALFALMSTLALPLASCAQAPDPQETKESIEDLSQQTDEPELSDAEQEFSVTEHPDPIVDPLDCSTHLILTVRGTSEPPKGQLLSPVARQISQALPKDSAQVVDLDYPASGDMEQSGTKGVRMLIDTLNVQAKECELQRVIVMGYSQGAMVVGDALEAVDDRTIGRASGKLTKTPPPLSKQSSYMLIRDSVVLRSTTLATFSLTRMDFFPAPKARSTPMLTGRGVSVLPMILFARAVNLTKRVM